ncbi:MAG TPA: DUF4239 domain-containing protein [Xanthobacteraceae bacterium]|jgi:hypothetical protein|nr:DUF4239 domain-containing protein [Xanthobacteraceae bacterium]
MLFFLTSQPLWISAAILVGLPTVLAVLGPSLVRRCVTLEKLTTNNEIAGFKFATVGVLYAVLLAFAIILVWEKFSDAERTVAQEAGAAETVYRLSSSLSDAPRKDRLRGALTAYLAVAAADDWPAMDHGAAEGSRSVRQALDELYASLLMAPLPQGGDAPLLSEILHQLDLITKARRARLIAAEGSVPSVIWVVLFSGAVLTVAFTFFFGTRSLPAQTMMTGLLSILIFFELLTIVMIDRPFSGAIRVEPRALADVLADFKPPEPASSRPSKAH